MKMRPASMHVDSTTPGLGDVQQPCANS